MLTRVFTSVALTALAVQSIEYDSDGEEVLAHLEDLIDGATALDGVMEDEYNGVIRRLLATPSPTESPSKDPTEYPLLEPTISPTECACFQNGDAGKITTTEMVIYSKADDSDIVEPDALVSPDVTIDGNTAKEWCEDKFGASSRVLFPQNYFLYREMQHMCTEKLDTTKCYFGMYRYSPNYNLDAGDCNTWKAASAWNGEDTRLSSARYFDWDAGQPKCNWGNPSDSQKTRHCMFYKYDVNATGVFNRRLVANKCDQPAHIICEWLDDPASICQC